MQRRAEAKRRKIKWPFGSPWASTPPYNSHRLPSSMGTRRSCVNFNSFQANCCFLNRSSRKAGLITLLAPSSCPARASSMVYCKLAVSWIMVRNDLQTCRVQLGARYVSATIAAPVSMSGDLCSRASPGSWQSTLLEDSGGISDNT